MEKSQSSFAVTCNLLSQYIKEKGRSFADLGIGKSDTYRVPTTMSLLPGVDVSADDAKEDVPDRNATRSMELFPQRAGLNAPAAADEREGKKSQLTIFYGGKVLVFDNFPAEKARDLMMLAGKGSGSAPAPAPAPVLAPTELKSSASPPGAARACPPRAVISDLPIARKASLHRFLEKRKDRINARAPYQMNQEKAAASPDSMITPKIEEENRPWLALNPGVSSDCRR